MFKKNIPFLFLVTLCVMTFAEDSQGPISPEQRVGELLNTRYENSEEQRASYIEAAKLLQAIGDLKQAAELFEKASLAVKGEKDFESLLKASVLNIEMASYRKAEANLRAVMMFAEAPALRMKASLLSARIMVIRGEKAEAMEILSSIFSLDGNIPPEAWYFASEYFTKEDLVELGIDISKFSDTAAYLDMKPMLTPEIVLGGYSASLSENITTEHVVEAGQNDNNSESSEVAGIQLGSFSIEDNASEMVKELNKIGFNAELRKKKVHDKIYFTVVVPVGKGQETQNIIIGLKEKGYEGYPVY